MGQDRDDDEWAELYGIQREQYGQRSDEEELLDDSVMEDYEDQQHRKRGRDRQIRAQEEDDQEDIEDDEDLEEWQDLVEED